MKQNFTMHLVQGVGEFSSMQGVYLTRFNPSNSAGWEEVLLDTVELELEVPEIDAQAIQAATIDLQIENLRRESDAKIAALMDKKGDV